nr:MAG TPA: hypothetical protein [Caudoviricetes sp.]
MTLNILDITLQLVLLTLDHIRATCYQIDY